MNATASTTRTTCNRCTTTQRSTAQYSTSFSKDRVIMLNLANNGFAMKRITLCSTFPLQIISCIFNKRNLLSVHVQTFIVCFPNTFVYILLIFLELLWLKIFNWICIKINIFFSLFCLLSIGLENIRVLFSRKKKEFTMLDKYRGISESYAFATKKISETSVKLFILKLNSFRILHWI